MIAYDKTGVVFALTDGSDLLLHDGTSEAPLWQTTLDGKIVGVGITVNEVAAVTGGGTVSWFGARSGDARRTVKLDAPVCAAAFDAQRVVAITERGIVRIVGEETTAIGSEAATCVALATDGTTLVATDSELIEIALDGSRRTCALAGVRAVAHHPTGFWLVGLDSKVLQWSGSGEPTHVTSLPAGSKLDHLATSPRAIGISWDHKMAVALAWPSKDTLGSVDYPERKVEGIAFGPWPWLGISLDLGDGNKFNLETIALHRSDTHPGREHHRWLVAVGGPPDDKPARTPAAPVRPAPAKGSGGGLPIGMLVLLAAVVIAIVLAVR
jgi:hypothetical protein